MNPWVYWKTKQFDLLEEKKVKNCFYGNVHFKTLDLALKKAYLGKNPYKICRRHLQKKGVAEIHAYGETPLTIMDQIVQECELTPEDTVFELGAGRGRSSLFLAAYIGCQVKAFEEIPLFAQSIQTLKCPNLEMVNQDYLEADFSKATAIYLYGTMLPDEEIQALAKKFPSNCKIITVSYSLDEYSSNYRTIKNFSGRFPWGQTEIFWNERIG